MFAKNVFIVLCLYNVFVAAIVEKEAAEKPDALTLLDQAHDTHAENSPLCKIYTSNIPKKLQLSLIAQFTPEELIKETIYLMNREKNLSAEVEKLKSLINNEIHHSQTTPEESKQKISLLAKNISFAEEKIQNSSSLIETLQNTLYADIALKTLTRSDQNNKSIAEKYQALFQIKDKNNHEEQYVKTQLSRTVKSAQTDNDWVIKYQKQGAQIQQCSDLYWLIMNGEPQSKIDTALHKILAPLTDKINNSVNNIINTITSSKKRLEKINVLKSSATVHLRATEEKLNNDLSQMNYIIAFLSTLEDKDHKLQFEQTALKATQGLHQLANLIEHVHHAVDTTESLAKRGKNRLTKYQPPRTRA